jgi:hypothetical protein
MIDKRADLQARSRVVPRRSFSIICVSRIKHPPPITLYVPPRISAPRVVSHFRRKYLCVDFDAVLCVQPRISAPRVVSHFRRRYLCVDFDAVLCVQPRISAPRVVSHFRRKYSRVDFRPPMIKLPNDVMALLSSGKDKHLYSTF